MSELDYEKFVWATRSKKRRWKVIMGDSLPPKFEEEMRRRFEETGKEEARRIFLMQLGFKPGTREFLDAVHILRMRDKELEQKSTFTDEGIDKKTPIDMETPMGYRTAPKQKEPSTEPSWYDSLIKRIKSLLR